MLPETPQILHEAAASHSCHFQCFVIVTGLPRDDLLGKNGDTSVFLDFRSKSREIDTPTDQLT